MQGYPYILRFYWQKTESYSSATVFQLCKRRTKRIRIYVYVLLKTENFPLFIRCKYLIVKETDLSWKAESSAVNMQVFLTFIFLICKNEGKTGVHYIFWFSALAWRLRGKSENYKQNSLEA